MMLTDNHRNVQPFFATSVKYAVLLRNQSYVPEVAAIYLEESLSPSRTYRYKVLSVAKAEDD
jgi:hypothetical protein